MLVYCVVDFMVCVVDFGLDCFVEWELVLIKVVGLGEVCVEVLCLVEVFCVKVIDVIVGYFIFEIIGKFFKID